MLAFKPEWQNRVEAEPRSAFLSVAAIVILIGFAGIS
jgi:hypothetical protein